MATFLPIHLGIKSKEYPLLIPLFIFSLFTGIFLASIDVTYHAIFLSQVRFQSIYRAYEMYGRVFFIAGGIGLILLTLYSVLVKIISWKSFSTLVYFFVLCFVSVYLWMVFSDLTRELLYVGFIVLFSINILMLLTYWRYNRKMLDAYQSRRFMPILELGLFGGIVIGGFGTLALSYYMAFYKVLLIAPITIVLAFLMQIISNVIHFRNPIFSHRKDTYMPVKGNFTLLLSTRYTRLLFLFVLLSAIIGFVIHFGFITMISISYDNPVGITKFLGLFTGCLFLFLYASQKLIVRRILYPYDSAYSLFVVPILILGMIGASLLVEIIMGNSKAIERFTFFFLLVGLTKVVYESTKHGIESPSLRVLFKSLDIRFRQIIESRVEGSLRLIGMVLAGLIIWGMSKLNFIQLPYILLVLLTLSIAWIFVTIKLVKAYQGAINENIRKLKRNLKATEGDLVRIQDRYRNLLNSESETKIINTLKFTENIEPVSHEKFLVYLVAHTSDEVKRFVLERIDQLTLFQALPKLESLPLHESNQQTEVDPNFISKKFQDRLSKYTSEKAIEDLLESKHNSDKILAADIIGNQGLVSFTNALANLSKDFEPEVKFAAIKAMARLGIKEHSYQLIEYLSSPQYYAYAFEALVNVGDPALDYLEKLFFEKDIDNIILARIVKIYGRIASQNAIDLLITKVENQNSFIVRQAILSLREARFQTNKNNIHRILNATVKILGKIGWNYYALQLIKNKRKYALLANSLQKEIEDNYKILYHLLALGYNSTSIASIKGLIENGDDIDVSYAIELLDHFVNEDIKQVLFPVMENISDGQRVNQLKYYFQIEDLASSEILSSIITRDFNLISLFTKATAILTYLEDDNKKIDYELIANLFHPDQLMWETTAYVMHKINHKKLKEIFPRLDSYIKEHILDTLNKVIQSDSNLLYNRVKFLRDIPQFEKIHEDVLAEIAKSMQVIQLAENSVLPVSAELHNYALIIPYQGALEYNEGDAMKGLLEEGEIFFSKVYSNKGDIVLKTNQPSIIFIIEEQTLNMLLFDNIEFTNSLLYLVEEAV